jgi:hypothetical protein
MLLQMYGGILMASTCPDCGKESLMMGNIGSLFGIVPWCANIHCVANVEGDLE